MSRFLRPGRLVIYGLLIWGLFSLFGGSSITPQETITIKEGQALAQTQLFDDLGIRKRYSLKRFLKKNDEDVKTIQPGSYVFTGSYTYDELLEVFLDGPVQTYSHLTLLEGWSSYDVDAYLADKGVAESGEYRSFIQDQEIISRYGQRYDFIAQALKEKGSIQSLEGYLYPSTYYVDPDLNMIDQLVYLQLEEFRKNIWEPYGEQLVGLSTQLSGLGYDFSLSTYGAMILASIVEKEERVPSNRVTISSVFYNRLNDGMRIDADISLCYGLGMTHKQCTPSIIGQYVYDANNPYNTRAVGGLPPTPISAITASSVKALIDAQPSQNYYYLHDSSGQIHVAKTLSEHNANKSKYIK